MALQEGRTGAGPVKGAQEWVNYPQEGVKHPQEG